MGDYCYTVCSIAKADNIIFHESSQNPIAKGLKAEQYIINVLMAPIQSMAPLCWTSIQTQKRTIEIELHLREGAVVGLVFQLKKKTAIKLWFPFVVFFVWSKGPFHLNHINTFRYVRTETRL